LRNWFRGAARAQRRSWNDGRCRETATRGSHKLGMGSPDSPPSFSRHIVLSFAANPDLFVDILSFVRTKLARVHA
jgi:hypothetical protein